MRDYDDGDGDRDQNDEVAKQRNLVHYENTVDVRT